MENTKFNLGFFATFGPPSWQADEDRLNGEDWYNGRFFVDLAQKLERSKFDFLFFEDTSTVSSAVGGKMDADLRFNIYSPKHDPLALLPMLAGATEKIGLIATASTTFYPPWILARQLSTIDNLSNGRIGWNVVTSGEKTAGQNFGMDDLPPHSVRYDMAGEYLDLTKSCGQPGNRMHWLKISKITLMSTLRRSNLSIMKVLILKFAGR